MADTASDFFQELAGFLEFAVGFLGAGLEEAVGFLEFLVGYLEQAPYTLKSGGGAFERGQGLAPQGMRNHCRPVTPRF